MLRDETVPKVSVIIPNYNHATYLAQRINSVLVQTFSDIEVILLDDFSKDNSSEIIQTYSKIDSRIRPVFNSSNSGSVFKQWAKGLSFAKGKYVWIAESDDFAEPNFLSTLVPILEQDSTLAFAYSNSLVVDSEGSAKEPISELKKRIFNTEHWHHDFVSDGKQELSQYLSLQCTVNNASAVLFRRSSIDEVGGVDTNFRYTGDWMMYIKLSLIGNIAYRAECLNNYREHEVNASKKSFSDGSQLFERQKCFAYVYKSSALDKVSTDTMLYYASIELKELQYHLFNNIKQPGKMLHMISEIIKISPAYYIKVQYGIIRVTKLWNKMRSLRDSYKG
ncbi:glycosyltransferase family 2 protein [Hymenobacter setariae]|uniref:glycosyltransferase family 2 protein n=1 Tax=Hymenobacter setariae TaxID=2594794 RepID=UPI001F3713EF|nr:glycosyltransferase [Hymenobacter setariae]